MNTIRMKRRDTGPAFTATILDADGAPVNLTGAAARFKACDAKSRETVIDGAMTITNAAAGRVSYTWQAADTADARSLDVEVEVTFGDGEIQTAPNGNLQDRFLRVEIIEDVGL